MSLSKEEFLKDFWGKKDQVKVDAEALKESLQTIEKQKLEIKKLQEENKRLQSQVIHYRTGYITLQSQEPVYVNLRA